MLIILISLTLIGGITLVLINYLSTDNAPYNEPTIDEIIALSYDTPEITTNLKSNDFARIQFKIQVDNKKALSEIQKRNFQLDNIIIRELAGMRASDLAGEEGIEGLESRLKLRFNELMQDGMVVQVYTTGWIIQ